MYIKKKKLAILGSTGSIGQTSLKIISNYSKYFDIDLLVCNKNEKVILSQIKKFLPKKVYIENMIVRQKIKSKINNKIKVEFLESFNDLKKKYLKKNKLDKVIVGISSIEGLKYSFEFVKYSKEILLANKESLVCGGKVLINRAKFYNCKILPIDSEHYCIAEILKYEKLKNVNFVYLTASGGPFLGKNKNIIAKSSVEQVTKHPNWLMGKKISVDSATMSNKIFEIIEAHVLFDIPTEKLKIKIHKESLVHSAVLFNNGLVKLIMHDTTMKIPIINSLLDNIPKLSKKNFFKDNKNFQISFDETNLSNFLIISLGMKILKLGHTAWILFNVFNDYYVKNFLNKKIFFYQIEKNLIKIFSNKRIIYYCKNKIRNTKDIMNTIEFAENFIRSV